MEQNKLIKIEKKPSDILRKLFKNFFRLIPFNREFSRTIAGIISKKLLRDNNIRDVRPSLIYSFETLNVSDYLISVISDAIKVAHKLNLKCGKTNLYDSKFLNQFPGEHYRILSASLGVWLPDLQHFENEEISVSTAFKQHLTC